MLVLNLTPSPQISTHVSKVVLLPPVQFQPVSRVQVSDHPSPITVLLSSQISSPTLRPSPQTSSQSSLVDESPFIHKYPVSVAHVSEHPSLAIVLLSSQ